jgi:hypothetical protein
MRTGEMMGDGDTALMGMPMMGKCWNSRRPVRTLNAPPNKQNYLGLLVLWVPTYSAVY